MDPPCPGGIRSLPRLVDLRLGVLQRFGHRRCGRDGQQPRATETSWGRGTASLTLAYEAVRQSAHRSVYACRPTFASWSIRAGVQLFYLSRVMGTSVAQIDATYGHLVPDSDDYLRGLLDEYDLGSRVTARN
jgi:integrase